MILCNYKDPRVTVHVSAFMEEGQLKIQGQDLGPAVLEFFDDSDYEYFYTLSKENTSALHELLKVDSGTKQGLLDLVAVYFSGLDGCKNFRDYCEQHNIPYEFFCH